jgi:hypothetical protein
MYEQLIDLAEWGTSKLTLVYCATIWCVPLTKTTSTSVAQQSPHHGPPAGLRVDGGDRDGRRPRRSGESGPQPSVLQPTIPTGQPPSGTPQHGSPHEKPWGPTASSHNAADDTAPAQTPAPAQINAKDTPEEVCDGVEHEEWVEDNPYGREGTPAFPLSPSLLARSFPL